MSRLRARNRTRGGAQPGGSSETTAPCSRPGARAGRGARPGRPGRPRRRAPRPTAPPAARAPAVRRLVDAEGGAGDHGAVRPARSRRRARGRRPRRRWSRSATRRPRPSSASSSSRSGPRTHSPSGTPPSSCDRVAVGEVVELGRPLVVAGDDEADAPASAARARALGSSRRAAGAEASGRARSASPRVGEDVLVADAVAPTFVSARADARVAGLGEPAQRGSGHAVRRSRRPAPSKRRAEQRLARPEPERGRRRRRPRACPAPRQIGERPGEPVHPGRAAAAQLAVVDPVVDEPSWASLRSGHSSVSAGPGTWPLSRQLRPA